MKNFYSVLFNFFHVEIQIYDSLNTQYVFQNKKWSKLHIKFSEHVFFRVFDTKLIEQ